MISPWPPLGAGIRSGRVLLLVLTLAGCGGRRDEHTTPPRSPTADGGTTAPAAVTPGDTAATDTGAGSVPPVRYGSFVLANPDSLRALQRRLGADGSDLVLRLNRIDIGHARQGDTLVVPSVLDPVRLAPFPGSLPLAGLPPRLLVVSARVQAFGAYETGRLARWGPTSTGRREMPTPAGLYHANWRQRTRRSTFDEGWILDWYVNLSNFDGISLHEYELPGRPASHSCVRLRADDAQWLYGWVETWTLVPGDLRRIERQGTPVIVLDEYAFDQSPPWRRLREDPEATTVPATLIGGALSRAGVLPPDTTAGPSPVTSDPAGDRAR